LRIVKASLPIETREVALTAQPAGSLFYSVSHNIISSFLTANFTNVHIAFVWTNELGYVLCSPDAPFLTTTLEKSGLTYSISGKNHTRFQPIQVEFEAVNAQYITNLRVSDSPIGSNIINGSGVGNLYENQIVAIQTVNGKKGVLKINSASKYSNQLTFTLKIQK